MVNKMVWQDLKYFLTNDCELSSKADLLRNIRKLWQRKMNDLAYCNAKFDHFLRVIGDTVIAMGERATDL
jgi:hypothetical protein